MKQLLAFADHVEMEHERELAPGTTLDQIVEMHDRMHTLGDDDNQYGHTHTRRGTAAGMKRKER